MLKFLQISSNNFPIFGLYPILSLDIDKNSVKIFNSFKMSISSPVSIFFKLEAILSFDDSFSFFIEGKYLNSLKNKGSKSSGSSKSKAVCSSKLFFKSFFSSLFSVFSSFLGELFLITLDLLLSLDGGEGLNSLFIL